MENIWMENSFSFPSVETQVEFQSVREVFEDHLQRRGGNSSVE